MKRFLSVLLISIISITIFVGCLFGTRVVNVTNIVLNKKNLNLKIGESYTLLVTLEPKEADESMLIWTSSSEEVATVEDGKVTAIAKGTTTITVMPVFGEKRAVCTVTVKEPAPEYPNTPDIPEAPEEPQPSFVSNAFFWGEWTRMDNGKSFVIEEDSVKYNSRTYTINSSTETTLEVTGIGSFEKESDSVMICSNIPYFRNGGTNLEYKLKVVGFTGGARAAATGGLSGIRGKGKSNTYKSFESEGTSDENGEITFKAPTINDIQTVTIENNGNDVVVSNLKIQNSGDFMGTVALVNADEYNLKITGVIADEDKHDGYLYANDAKAYPMTITITNISDVKCKTSVCKIEADDPNLVLSSSTNLSGLVISTLPEGGTKEITLTAQYGSLNVPFIDTGIKITITNPTTDQEWTDYIPLRFYKGTIPIAVYAKSPERNADAALNGFVIYPDGNNQFFAIGENTSRVLYVPTFGSGKKYRMIFSGATVTSELSASTEMFYTVAAGSINPVEPVTVADAGELMGYITFGGNNNSEDSAYEVNEDFEAYLSEGEIDYYTITADSEEFYSPDGNGYYVVSYTSEYDTENIPDSFVVPDGSSLTASQLPILTQEYMTFDGWYDGSTRVNAGLYTVMNSVTLTAHWNYTRYRITYNLNGGTKTASNPSTYTVNDTVTLAAPTKAYYDFAGWYDNADFEGDAITGYEEGTSGAKTLYAKWTPVNYTITYELDGKGTNAASNPSTYNIDTDDIVLAAPKSEGYVFGGWFTTPEFTGTQTDKIEKGSHGDITLYARWAEKRNVTYVSGHGTQPEAIKVVDGTVLSSVQLASLTDASYLFMGWYSDEEYNAQAVADTYTVSGGDVTLYARWAEKRNVTYVSEHGTQPEAIVVADGTVLSSVQLASLTDASYLFMGWYSDEEYNAQAVADTYTVSGEDVTLYAKWLKKCTITYVTAYGTAETVEVAENTELTAEHLPSLHKDRYVMRGWYTETEHENKITNGYTITDDMTLYAFWEKYTETFVLVEGGTFTMGALDYNYTRPAHSVTLSDFFMSPYEMTQKIYAEIMGTNPSYFSSSSASGEVQEERPVEGVSWYDAIYFCNKYSEANGFTPCYKVNGSTDVTAWGYTPHNENSISGTITCDFTADGYRLPTEAEWEYAAKGGKNKDSYLYSGSDTAGDVAWYDGNSGSKTHQVGLKAANSLGLYDMSGNVWEWCWDWYGGYTSEVQTNPTGAASGSYRVLRGGSWYNVVVTSARCANRSDGNPISRSDFYGFRVVRSAN